MDSMPARRRRIDLRGDGRQLDDLEVPFAEPRRSYTKSFERYVLELSRSMTILDVAHHLDVGWDTVKDIQKRDLSRRYAKPKLKHLRAIAIDEIAVAKGHRYLTVVMDLEGGAVVADPGIDLAVVGTVRQDPQPPVREDVVAVPDQEYRPDLGAVAFGDPAAFP